MEEIKEFYDIFEAIQRTYNGNNTDWSEKCQELWGLYGAIDHFRPRSSKHAAFYDYIRRKLKEDIYDEYHRVLALALKND